MILASACLHQVFSRKALKVIAYSMLGSHLGGLGITEGFGMQHPGIYKHTSMKDRVTPTRDKADQVGFDRPAMSLLRELFTNEDFITVMSSLEHQGSSRLQLAPLL